MSSLVSESPTARIRLIQYKGETVEAAVFENVTKDNLHQNLFDAGLKFRYADGLNGSGTAYVILENEDDIEFADTVADYLGIDIEIETDGDTDAISMEAKKDTPTSTEDVKAESEEEVNTKEKNNITFKIDTTDASKFTVSAQDVPTISLNQEEEANPDTQTTLDDFPELPGLVYKALKENTKGGNCWFNIRQISRMLSTPYSQLHANVFRKVLSLLITLDLVEEKKGIVVEGVQRHTVWGLKRSTQVTISANPLKELGQYLKEFSDHYLEEGWCKTSIRGQVQEELNKWVGF